MADHLMRGLAAGADDHGLLRLFDRTGKSVTWFAWTGATGREVAGVLAGLRAVEASF